MIQFFLRAWQSLVFICIVDEQFYSCWLYAALARTMTKTHASVIAQNQMGNRLIWLAMPAEWMICAVCPLKLSHTDYPFPICFFLWNLWTCTILQLLCPVHFFLLTPRKLILWQIYQETCSRPVRVLYGSGFWFESEFGFKYGFRYLDSDSDRDLDLDPDLDPIRLPAMVNKNFINT